jgi:hypothetical protein
MSVDAVTLLFALLAVAAQVAVLASLALWAGGFVSAPVARLRSETAATIGAQAMPLALVVALVATVGSLYLSEVANFIPCKLCWYQRIAMYPLVVVFGVAALRSDARAWIYGAVMAAVGAAISAYHVAIERFPSLDSASCDPNAPCSLKWVEHFGYLTIPTMAGSAFLLILALMLSARSVKELDA